MRSEVGSSAADAKAHGSRSYEIVPGVWKLACAVAVLCGHNLITLYNWRADEPIWGWMYHVIQFFSPLHFFFFSGYLAASGLIDVRRGMRGMVASRAVRVYALAVTALAWGVLARVALTAGVGGPSLDGEWPLLLWKGAIDWSEALRHMNPFGFADHVSFNYGVWYLYQEIRLAFLFPVFRWILLRRDFRTRLALLLGTMAGAALLEYVLWPWFPMFRSSPFQTIGYGCYFLAGSIVWMELRDGGLLRGIGRSGAVALVLVGLVVSFGESAGIRPPLDNPIVLMVPILFGQILVAVGLTVLTRGVEVPLLVRRMCDTSVGIYIIHPPIHVVCAYFAFRSGSILPIATGIVLSILIGALYHRFVEVPSQKVAKWAADATAPRSGRGDVA